MGARIKGLLFSLESRCFNILEAPGPWERSTFGLISFLNFVNYRISPSSLDYSWYSYEHLCVPWRVYYRHAPYGQVTRKELADLERWERLGKVPSVKQGPQVSRRDRVGRGFPARAVGWREQRLPDFAVGSWLVEAREPGCTTSLLGVILEAIGSPSKEGTSPSDWE